MRTALLTALCLVVLTLAGCSAEDPGTAQDPGGPSVPPDAVGPGALVAGVVVDGEQLPVAGAAVGLIVEDTNDIDRETKTGSDGRFNLGRVGEGAYVMHVNAVGYRAYTSHLVVVADQDQTELVVAVEATPVAEAHYLTVEHRFEITFGLGWSIGGDFNQGCIQPGVTCQAIGFPNPNMEFEVDDSNETPLATIVIEETWQPNVGVCAQGIAIDLYSPENDGGPDFANPDYWTNYPSDVWGIKSPVVMVIPRDEPANPEAMNADVRVEKNDDEPIDPDGAWLLRNFPPGTGLTGLPVDANCFTDQRMDVYVTTFYLDPAPEGFAARPDA